MKIRVLFMQRREDYPGEFGPEVLLAIDEFSSSENPDNWVGSSKPRSARTRTTPQASQRS